jgi:16S rRNA (guanine966-N2)-methyltransferase
MRVISGIARGRKLYQPSKGTVVRPITDRAKESLFNILGDGIENSTFLDLFGGTGSVGIEALSRGASQVTFVEKDRRCLKLIKRNLEHTNLAENSDLFLNDAFRFLKTSPHPFKHIFIAPPQYQEMWSKALLLIDVSPEWLDLDGEVIVQIDPNEFLQVDLKSLVLVDQRCYSNVMLCFYKRIER